MLHLLAKTADRRVEKEERRQQRFDAEREQEEQQRRHSRDGSTGDDSVATPSPAAASSSSAGHLRLLSAPSSDSFLSSSSSPLSFVSALSSSILHSAKHSLREVRAGVERGIGGIEAAAERAQRAANAEEDDGDEAAEDDSKEAYEADSKRAPASSSRNWALRADESDVEDDDDNDSAPTESLSAPTSPLSASALSIRRINFLRLLARMEDMCHRHLHAPPGEVPLLHVRAGGERNEQAQAFFRGVALLQRELVEHFSRGGARGRGARGAPAQAMLHPEPRKDVELRRRVGFLATVSEKESASAAAVLASTGGLPLLTRGSGAWGDANGGVTKRRGASVNAARSRAASSATFSSAAGGSSHAIVAPALAPGVHSLRSSSVASIAAAALHAAAEAQDVAASPAPAGSTAAAAHALAAAAAESDATAAAAAFGMDDSAAELLERAPPPMDPTQELRAQLFARSTQRSAAAGASSSSHAQSAEFRAELEQRALLSELHSMTEDLKSNALALQKALGADKKHLEQADALLDRNLVSIAQENSRLKAWASRGCSEMCWNMLLIVILWVVFFATFLFIKIFPAPKS